MAQKSLKKPTHLPTENQLSAEQQLGLEILASGENVFLTGGAGSGKSYLLRKFMQSESPKTLPILASTGAAAVLVGGRTFHSFFGLGIMDGGPQATLDRVMMDRKALTRISKVEGVVIDEISMISKEALEVAENLSRVARDSDLPWGGMRVIAVGDFAQLPPVNADFCFKSPVWNASGFQVVKLAHNQRVQEDPDYLEVLSHVRWGKYTEKLHRFLESHIRQHDPDDKNPRLFPRRHQVDRFNQHELSLLSGADIRIPSIYLGQERFVEILKKSAPVAEELVLKVGAKVLFIQNDPQKRWINGTRGTIISLAADKIVVEKDRGREVTVDKTTFSMQNAEGEIVASVINFPLALAYATTIHKSQGATLDNLWVDLSQLWESGQAYVALSRLRSSQGLSLTGFSRNSFKVDPSVVQFYQSL